MTLKTQESSRLVAKHPSVAMGLEHLPFLHANNTVFQVLA